MTEPIEPEPSIDFPQAVDDMRMLNIMLHETNGYFARLHAWASRDGRWDLGMKMGNKLALCLMTAHLASEATESFDAARAGNPPDKDLPQHDSLTVELADVIMMAFDIARTLRLPITDALFDKLVHIEKRPTSNGRLF